MMILLTGGSGCGKSSFAERLCMEMPLPRYYIAAMKPYGEGGMEKVERHRKMRAGKGFETFECYTEMEKLTLPARGTTLLECVCNLTANEMFDETGNVCDPYARVLAGVENLRGQSETLIVVTNDVGSESATARRRGRMSRCSGASTRRWRTWRTRSASWSAASRSF